MRTTGASRGTTIVPLILLKFVTLIDLSSAVILVRSPRRQRAAPGVCRGTSLERRPHPALRKGSTRRLKDGGRRCWSKSGPVDRRVLDSGPEEIEARAPQARF